ncbi:MAG: (Fe-S)-binding protein [Actinomycetota bacterium]
MALIEDYELELSTPECDLESSIYRATVRLGADISDVLPFVNATVEKAEYIAGVPVLVWSEGAHRYALRADEIAVSNISDRGEATRIVQELVSRINSIWERRDQIEPSYASYERPKVLDVLKLLPRTNCGQCGVPACMAFADAVIREKKLLADCPPLCGEECAGQLAALREMGL